MEGKLTLLIARAERVLSEEVPARPDVVRDFYTDLNNMTALHPLIVAVRTTGRTETADGYVATYRIHDRIPLGPRPLAAMTVREAVNAHIAMLAAVRRRFE